MRLIDEQYLHTPFYGSRGMTQWLIRQGHDVNRKRVQRLMRVMGLEAIYPRRRTSVPLSRTSDLPVFTAESGDRAARPGVERGHHLRAAAAGLHVPGGGARLAQPLRAVVGAVEHAGQRVLRGGPGSGSGPAAARDLQHRSRGAVHQPGVHGTAGGGGRGDQHGWPRPSPRQRVHRAAVANREVREHLPARLRDGGGVGVRLGVVLRLLLLRAAAHGAGLPNAVGGVFGGPAARGVRNENFSAQKILACGQTLKLRQPRPDTCP